MKLHELKPAPGSTKRRKRVGRGASSGMGKTASRGHKGQSQRSGFSLPLDFEGGQTPLYKRFRKVGFNNPHRKEFQTVNVSELNRYEDGTVVTPQMLREQRLIGKARGKVKILGDGEIKRKLTVKAHKFTASAEKKIQAAGGTTEVI